MKCLEKNATIVVILMLLGPPARGDPQSVSDEVPSVCASLALPASANSQSAVKQELCRRVEKVPFPGTLYPPAFKEQLTRFYLANEFEPVWLESGGPAPQALTMIQTLQDASRKGLVPADYDGPLWNTRLARLAPAAAPSPSAVAEFDFELTVAAIRYISDLHSGRVDPRPLQFALDVKRKQYDAAEFLRNYVVHATDVKQALELVEPPFAGYQRAIKALQDYQALATAGEFEPLPALSRPLKPGDKYAGVAQLAQQLRRLGDLPQNGIIVGQANTYDGPLIDAVRRFQSRHGLTPDGTIGKETYEQLSIPLSQRIIQLQLTLERWRWVPDGLQPPLILVNIPEFQLRAYEGHQAALSMKAIVGKAEDHETPVFADQLEFVIFRPYWNVPESIQRNELVPELSRNPKYLLQHHLEIVNSRGQLVAADQAGADLLKQLESGKLTLRQLPGPANSLGLVKFVFPNQYSIYLHGTPEKQLFSKFRRDLSHGCIRVEDPAALAAWILRDDPRWDPKRISVAMRGKHSTLVKLVHPIPVLIVYGTAFVEENGDVHFFADIYGHDAALELALAERARTQSQD